MGDLRASIAGVLLAGDKLPSDRDLAARYGTARNTAREAISLLQGEGLVVAQHGRGVFVRTRLPLMRLQPLLARPARTNRAVAVPDRGHRTEPRPTHRVPLGHPGPPADVANRLNLDPQTEVVRRENWYYADEVPVQVGVPYIPVEVAADSPLASEKTLGRGASTPGSKTSGTRSPASARRSAPGCRPTTS